MDQDEKLLIDLLLEKPALLSDCRGTIYALAALLSIDALPNLILLLKDDTLHYELREDAAKAIATIGSSHVHAELDSLRTSGAPSLIHLLDLAEGIKK